MTIYNYIRVATREQNVASQREAMINFNKENGFDLRLCKEIVEKQSGTIKQRLKLAALLELLCPGDLVVIQSIDRLSRNYRECLDIWKEIVEEKEADIVIIDMPLLDTRNSEGNLSGKLISDITLMVLGYVAQQENDFRKKRQREGIDAMPLGADGKRFSTKKGKGRMGRPVINQPEGFVEEYTKWKAGEQTATATWEKLGLKKATFYRVVKTYEEQHNIVSGQ